MVDMRQRSQQLAFLLLGAIISLIGLVSLVLLLEKEPSPDVLQSEILPELITQDLPEKDLAVEKQKRFTLVASGDLLIHTPISRKARDKDTYNYKPFLASVKPFLTEADLALCHLETPMSLDNTNLAGYPLFNIPYQFAEAIADSGWDSCSLASNHSWDSKDHGLLGTLQALDAVQVEYSGMASSRKQAETLNILPLGDYKLAHLSYTYGINTSLPDHPWQVNRIKTSAIIEEAKRARQAKADFVLVSLHWGDEYQTQPSSYQQRIAKELTADSNIDMIIGHHAHVVQPLSVVNDKYVAYGLGNFLSNQHPAGCQCPISVQDGVILYIMLEVNNQGKMQVQQVAHLPTRVDRSTMRVIPIPNSGVLTSKDIESRRRTQQALNSDGQKVLHIEDL